MNRGKTMQGGRGTAGAAAAGPAGLWLWGWHPVRQALANPQRRCRRLLATAEALAGLDGLLAEHPNPPAVEMAERATLDRHFPGQVHQGLALRCDPLPSLSLGEFLAGIDAAAPCLLVALDQVTDPHNVGAILRSAAAYGAAALIHTRHHAPAETGVMAKAASGALDVLPLVEAGNLARALDTLAQAGFLCLGLDGGGADRLDRLELPGRVCLVLGAEGAGLRRLTRERCERVARLPTVPPISSLNVSAAAASALYALAMRRNADNG